MRKARVKEALLYSLQSYSKQIESSRVERQAILKQFMMKATSQLTTFAHAHIIIIIMIHHTSSYRATHTRHTKGDQMNVMDVSMDS